MTRKLKLSDAEAELIELIREGRPFGIQVLLCELGGEWTVSTTAPPFENVSNLRIASEPTFDEAWMARRPASDFVHDSSTRLTP